MTINRPLAIAFSLVLTAAAVMSLVILRDARQTMTEGVSKHTPATMLQAPLYFEPNRGQASPQAQFVSRAPGVSLELREGAVQLALDRADRPAARVSLTWVGGRSDARVTAEDRLTGTVNYIHGRDESKWVRDVPTFRGVRYSQVYPGVDVVFYGNPRRLEYDFLLDPGVDPDVIRLSFSGNESASLEPGTGDLLLHVDGRSVRQHAPVAYQHLPARTTVGVRYRLNDDGTVGLSVDDWDRSQPLVIDPVLNWSTYLGGSGRDWVSGAGVSGNGDIILVGAAETRSSWSLPNSTEDSDIGLEAFLTRFSAAGVHLSTTFFGGDGGDQAQDVAFDADNNVYLTGTTTSRSFPTTANAAMKESASLELTFRVGLPRLTLGEIAFDSGASGDGDAFLIKFDPHGSAPLYSTYLGGSPEMGIKLGAKAKGQHTISFEANPGAEFGRSIAVTPTGEAYVVGYTESNSFPVTPTAFKSELEGLLGAGDGFLTKIDTNRSGLASFRFSTYLGGNCRDDATAVALDSDMKVYVIGTSEDDDLLCGGFDDLPGNGAHRTRIGGIHDGYLLKVVVDEGLEHSDDDIGILAATFFGTAGRDQSGDVMVDHAGNVYVSFEKLSLPQDPSVLYVAAFSPTLSTELFLKSLGESRSFNSHQGLRGLARARAHGFTGRIAGNITRLQIVRNALDGTRLHDLLIASNGTPEESILDLSSGNDSHRDMVVLTAASTPRVLVVAGAVSGSALNAVAAAQPANADAGVDGVAAGIRYSSSPVVGTVGMFPFDAVLEGVGKTLFASVDRPERGGALLSVVIEWGDGSTTTTTQTIFSSSDEVAGFHVYADDGVYNGRLCVTEVDAFEPPNCQAFSVTVLNVAPTVQVTNPVVDGLTPGATFRPEGTGVLLQLSTVAHIDDPGLVDIHTATVRFGTAPPVPVEVSPSRDVINLSFALPAGVNLDFNAEVCATDDEGARGCATFVVSPPTADLQATRVGPSSVIEGQTGDFTVTVKNNGPDASPNTTIRDLLPASPHLTYLGALAVGGGTGDPMVTEAHILPRPPQVSTLRVAVDGTTAVASSTVYERSGATFEWERVADLSTQHDDAAAILGNWIAVARKGFNTSPTAHVSGSVQLYHRVDGVWQAAQLLGPTDALDETFGTAVAIGNDVLAVGDPGRKSGAGGVTLYRRNGNVWSPIGVIEAPSVPGTCMTHVTVPCTDSFGEAVALTPDGGVLAVGAPDGGAFGPGGDYVHGTVVVYTHSQGTWQGATRLKSPRAEDTRLQRFGAAIALSDDNVRPLLVIGAPDDPGGLAFGNSHFGGRASVFRRNTNGSWTHVSELVPNDSGQEQHFGRSVDVSGNRVVVGTGPALTHEDPSNAQQDHAYLFAVETDSASQILRLRPSPTQDGDAFGWSVGVSGGEIVASAPLRGSLGEAYVFSSCGRPSGLGSLECNVGPLASGAAAKFLVTIRFGEGVIPAGSTSTNVTTTSQVFGGATDPQPSTNSASKVTTVTNNAFAPPLDLTPPEVAPVITGPLGSNGWHTGGAAGLSWTVVDTESAITSTTACGSQSVSSDTNGETFTCVATSAGGTTTVSATLRRDTTPPTISATVAPIADGSAGKTYRVTFTCADPATNGAASGIASCPGPANVSAGGVVRRTVADRAGHQSAAVEVAIPRVVAGPSQEVSVGDNCSAAVQLSAAGSGQAGGAPLTLVWRLGGNVIATGPNPIAMLAAGIHDIELVETSSGLLASDITRVSVIDDVAPVFTSVPGDITVDATGELTSVAIPAAMATDACPVTVTTDAPAQFLAGNTTIVFTASDSFGNVTKATAKVTVQPVVDVGISTPANVSLVAGGTAPLAVTLTNAGPSRAANIQVRPVLPAGVVPVKIATDAESCAVGTEGTTVCTPITVYALNAVCGINDEGFGCLVPALDAGRTLTFSLTLDTAVNVAGQPQATLAASTRERDSDGSNDTATATFEIIRSADVAVAFDGPDAVTAGAAAVFTAAIENHGPSSASGVVLQLPLSALSPVSPLPGGCAVVPGSGEQDALLSCVVGDLMPGASIELDRITLTVSPAARGTLAITALITGAEADPIVDNNNVSIAAPVATAADLAVAISPQEPAAVAGRPTVWTVTAANHGPSDATTVVLQVLPRAGASLEGALLPAGCAAVAPSQELATHVRCEISRVEPGQPRAFDLSFAVAPSQRGTVQLEAALSAAEPDPDTADNVVVSTQPIDARAGLRVTMSAAPIPAVAGATLSYQIQVSNDGPSSARQARVDLARPADMSFVSGPGCDGTSASISCDAGDLEAGGARDFTITLRPDQFARGQITATATVSSGAGDPRESDPDPSDNSAAVTVELQTTSDLVAAVSADSTEPIAGSGVTFTIRGHNAGPSGVRNAALSLTVPAGVSVPEPSSGCTFAGQTLTCEFADLASGAERIISVPSVVDPFARGGADASVHIAATEDHTDEDATNNSAAIAVTPVVDMDLSIHVSESADPATAGLSVSYTLRAITVGPSGSLNVSSSFELGDGLSFEVASAGCTHASGVVTCSADRINPDGSTSWTIGAHIDQFRRAGLETRSSVTSTDPDRDAGNNAATETTAVTTSSDLSVALVDTPDPAVAGTFLTYTATISNAGPSGAESVSLVDAMPANVMFVRSDPDGCTLADGVVSCALGPLGADEHTSVRLVVVPMAAARVVNTVDVTAAENDPDLTNNRATIDTSVSGAAGGTAGAGDFDGDGDLDLAVADEKTDRVKILRNNGHGVFTQIQQVSVGRKPQALAIGDLDGDGDLDMATVNRQSDDLSVLTNDGQGRFTETARPEVSGKHPVALALGDMDTNGSLDIVVALNDADGISWLTRDAAGAWTERNAGQGGAGFWASTHPGAIALGDIDGDGDLDIALATKILGRVRLLTNNGAGAFNSGATLWLQQLSLLIEAVSFGDLDLDGDLDVAAVSRIFPRVAVAHNDGLGGFAQVDSAWVGRRPEALALADFTGDGALDAMTANRNDNSVSLLVNVAGTFPDDQVSESPAGQKPTALVVGDVNGDGRLDVVVVSDKAIVTVLLNPTP